MVNDIAICRVIIVFIFTTAGLMTNVLFLNEIIKQYYQSQSQVRSILKLKYYSSEIFEIHLNEIGGDVNKIC